MDEDTALLRALDACPLFPELWRHHVVPHITHLTAWVLAATCRALRVWVHERVRAYLIVPELAPTLSAERLAFVWHASTMAAQWRESLALNLFKALLGGRAVNERQLARYTDGWRVALLALVGDAYVTRVLTPMHWNLLTDQHDNLDSAQRLVVAWQGWAQTPVEAFLEILAWWDGYYARLHKSTSRHWFRVMPAAWTLATGRWDVVRARGLDQLPGPWPQLLLNVARATRVPTIVQLAQQRVLCYHVVGLAVSV